MGKLGSRGRSVCVHALIGIVAAFPNDEVRDAGSTCRHAPTAGLCATNHAVDGIDPGARSFVNVEGFHGEASRGKGLHFIGIEDLVELAKDVLVGSGLQGIHRIGGSFVFDAHLGSGCTVGRNLYVLLAVRYRSIGKIQVDIGGSLNRRTAPFNGKGAGKRLTGGIPRVVSGKGKLVFAGTQQAEGTLPGSLHLPGLGMQVEIGQVFARGNDGAVLLQGENIVVHEHFILTGRPFCGVELGCSQGLLLNVQRRQEGIMVLVDSIGTIAFQVGQIRLRIGNIIR